MPEPDPAKVKTLMQLMALAFDSSSTESESVTALAKAVSLARRERISFYDVKQMLPAECEDRAGLGVRDAKATRMPFGKFKGRTLGSIMLEQPDYLDWVLGWINDNCRNRYRILCEKIEMLI